MFFYVWFLIPETKGMSLERMDDIFGVTELAKGHIDEEVARAPTNDEKPHNTYVQETTADVISPQAQTLREEENKI